MLFEEKYEIFRLRKSSFTKGWECPLVNKSQLSQGREIWKNWVKRSKLICQVQHTEKLEYFLPKKIPQLFSVLYLANGHWLFHPILLLQSFHIYTSLRWLGTVVTSHTASNWQAYTLVKSMLQKAVQSTHCKFHCTSCNRPAHTNVIMLYAVKCSLYVVCPFLCRTLHRSWSTRGENVTKLLGVPKRTRWHMKFFR